MPETAEPPTVASPLQTAATVTRPRQPAFPRQVRSLAKSLFLEGFSPVDIESKIRVPSGTIRKWIQRDKWYLFKDDSKVKAVQSRGRMSVSVSIPTQSQQSARVRNVLGAVVERQASIMANADNVSLNDILTNPQRQGHAAALKTIADTASVVFDWESQRTPGIILIGDVEQSEPEDQPIEVSGVTVEPEVIADTTTGSVQPQ